MHGAIRCIALVIGVFAGVAGWAQPARTDTFVLHFDFDRSNIRPADSVAFRAFAMQLTPGETGHTRDVDSIAITGYTDTVGTVEYNLRLSLRRAMAATNLFRQWLGPDASLLLRMVGRGEADPMPGDNSESRRATVICWHHAPPLVTVRTDTLRIEPEPDTVFELDDIRFFANTANLTDAARLSLPRYINYLVTFKDRYLEIDGYCNSPGPPLPPTDPLYILSIQRARFIYDYLVENGFDPEKLVYKGKGNTNPRRAHPTTRNEMDQNMRVEIRVFTKKPEP